MVDRADTRYSSPPIVEAVLEVRPISPLSVARVKRVSDQIGKKYDQLEAKRPLEANIDFSARSVTFKEGDVVYTHHSSDMVDQFTIAPTSISWVRRAPYEGWENFLGRIRPEFTTFMKQAGRPQLSRVGLRYVNRIDVPAENGICRYEDYLNFHIQHGTITEPSNGFEWKVAKQFPDTGLNVVLQSAVLSPEIPGTSGFSLDIDVYADQAVPNSDEGFFLLLQSLRDLKNRIFEEGVSEKAKGLYR